MPRHGRRFKRPRLGQTKPKAAPKPTTDPVFKDKAGQIVLPGDFVIYACGKGRDAHDIAFGKVYAVFWGAASWGPDIFWPKLRVQGVRGNGQLLQLRGWGYLRHSETVIKLLPVQVPATVRDLFKGKTEPEPTPEEDHDPA